MNRLSHSPLNKPTAYPDQYAPELLFPIARQPNRDALGIKQEALPFHGYDLWNAFEVSWLNPKGKPCVATAELIIPCSSPFLIESKSLKLYLNSLNNTRFDNQQNVAQTIQTDLKAALKSSVTVTLHQLAAIQSMQLTMPSGTCVDDLDISIDCFEPNPKLLTTQAETVSETLYSDLLKSNCPATGQPDWGSIQITYQGPKIDPAGLLRYIVSLRNHQEFHEQCAERIFMDILERCTPIHLSLTARYTRRGGLDINPFRSTDPQAVAPNLRLIRQ